MPRGSELQPIRDLDPDRPYYRAARYASEQDAGTAYGKLQLVLAEEQCQLSNFRIIVKEIQFVVVLGTEPTEATDGKIISVLSEKGDEANLSQDVIGILANRRKQTGGNLQSFFDNLGRN